MEFQSHRESILLGIGSLVAVWAVFLFLCYRLKGKDSIFSRKVVPEFIHIINLFFLYLLVRFLLDRIALPDTWETYGSVALRTLIVIGVISILVRTINKVIDYTAQMRHDRDKSSSILKNFIAIIFWIVGFLFILNSMGISITPMLTALGVGGIAVALAVQAPLANLFAGMQILMTKQIRPGDYIRLTGGEEGTIQDISWRTTILQTRGEMTVIIPNSMIASTILVNNSWPRQACYITISLQVGYDSDLERVQEVALEVAKEVSLEVSKKSELAEQATARFSRFGDYGIGLNISLKAGDYLETSFLTDALIKKIHQRFKEENIVIPYPIRQIITEEKIEK